MRKGYIYFNNSHVEVEIPTTKEEMEMGLMYRTNLSGDSGMLFIFNEESIHKIWMKNTLIPLDVIWLDSRGVIVHIDKNVMPCDADSCYSFGPELYIKFVIELNGGYSNRHNINVGDSVRMVVHK